MRFPIPEEHCEGDSLVSKHNEELSQVHSSLFPFLSRNDFVYMSFLCSDPCLIKFRCKKRSVVGPKMEIILTLVFQLFVTFILPQNAEGDTSHNTQIVLFPTVKVNGNQELMSSYGLKSNSGY